EGGRDACRVLACGQPCGRSREPEAVRETRRDLRAPSSRLVITRREEEPDRPRLDARRAPALRELRDGVALVPKERPGDGEELLRELHVLPFLGDLREVKRRELRDLELRRVAGGLVAIEELHELLLGESWDQLRGGVSQGRALFVGRFA